MPGIKSPIGSSNNFGPQPQMRTFEVSDESEDYGQEQAPHGYAPRPQGYATSDVPYPGAIPISPQYGTGRGGFVVNAGPPPEGHQFGAPPQGGMQFGAPQQPQMTDAERQIRAARQQKASGRIPMNSYAKERIQFLLDIGRQTRDVEVGGTVFSLRTLKGRESREALAAAAAVPQIEVLFEGRRQQLARSIYKIDGVDVDTAIGTNSLEEKLYILDEMDDNLMNHLYSNYSELNEDANKRFGIKPDENVEQLVTDIKK